MIRFIFIYTVDDAMLVRCGVVICYDITPFAITLFTLCVWCVSACVNECVSLCVLVCVHVYVRGRVCVTESHTIQIAVS